MRSLCLLFALFVVSAAEEHWDYHDNGPSVWGKTYATCDGKKQSPVMLNRANAVETPSWLLISEGISIKFLNYDTIGKGNFINNGHSVSLGFNYSNPATQPQVVISSPTSRNVYLLQNLHFHWQSEHWIENMNYPLEMHMVHKDPTNDDILVIGYMFVACGRNAAPRSRWYARSSTGIEDLALVVGSMLRETGDAVELEFAPSRVMPGGQGPCGYFSYSGSLTTPPCTEGVTWLVRQQPLCLGELELQEFYSVHDANHLLMAGNARPLQPLNKRPVLFFTC